MATAISGRTESGDEFLKISEEDIKSEEFIIELLEEAVGKEELPYVSSLNIVSTVWEDPYAFYNIENSIVEKCEEMRDEL